MLRSEEALRAAALELPDDVAGVRVGDEGQHWRLRLGGHARRQHRQHLGAHVDQDSHLRFGIVEQYW